MQVQVTSTYPAWLSSEYVQQKLRVYLKDTNVELQQLELSSASTKGGNYASVLTRINVKYADKNLHQQTGCFLVKTKFANESSATHMLEEHDVYVREMNMYQEVLPKLANIINTQLGDTRKMFAGTVSVDRKLESIMFEDMSLQSYRVADRLKQLDLDHTRLVLEKLAKFHAAGAVLHEKQPKIFENKYDRCFFNPHTRAFKPFIQNMLRALITSLEDDKMLHERYAAKLNGVMQNVMEYGERAMQVNSVDFATLCHGDLWTTNMMFNYNDDEKPNNVIFIDFQFCVYCSPAIDLHFFFATSVQDNIFLDHQTELVQFYYQNLVQSLNKLKFTGQVPSLFAFQLQFQKRAFYATFCSLAFLPMMLYAGKEELPLEKAINNNECDAAVRVSLYKNDIIQRKLKLLLPFFDHKGLLDPM